MGLGGVILAGVGIIMVVLVANDRWDATWNSMLGNGAPQIPGGAHSGTISYVDNGTGGATFA